MPQPHKTIVIHAGYYAPNDNCLGSTPNEYCHPMNDAPTGTAGVYLSAFRESLTNVMFVGYDRQIFQFGLVCRL